ncbi:MAG: hypothetical protein AABW48_05745 [Nanoarchaeota archaeon]
MEKLGLQILIFAYASVNIIGIVGYLPTIKDLWVNKKMSANTNSYFIWTVSSAITFLYSLLVLPDFWFRIVSGLSFGCCALIWGLCLLLKYRK